LQEIRLNHVITIGRRGIAEVAEGRGAERDSVQRIWHAIRPVAPERHRLTLRVDDFQTLGTVDHAAALDIREDAEADGVDFAWAGEGDVDCAVGIPGIVESVSLRSHAAEDVTYSD
jgi:hypothetical protein